MKSERNGVIHLHPLIDGQSTDHFGTKAQLHCNKLMRPISFIHTKGRQNEINETNLALMFNFLTTGLCSDWELECLNKNM